MKKFSNRVLMQLMYENIKSNPRAINEVMVATALLADAITDGEKLHETFLLEGQDEDDVRDHINDKIDIMRSKVQNVPFVDYDDYKSKKPVPLVDEDEYDSLSVKEMTIACARTFIRSGIYSAYKSDGMMGVNKVFDFALDNTSITGVPFEIAEHAVMEHVFDVKSPNIANQLGLLFMVSTVAFAKEMRKLIQTESDVQDFCDLENPNGIMYNEYTIHLNEPSGTSTKRHVSSFKA